MLVFVKIIYAVIVGAILGYERELSKKPAGLRDIILVTLGALIFTLLNDPQNRMIANIITGVGFLGGGVIIKNTDYVEGVTTAVVLWLAVGMGTAIGLGKFFLVFLALIVASVVLYFKRVKEILK